MSGLWLRAVLLGAFAGALGFGAEATCPFINTATASGILGGKVQVSVVPGPANSGDAVCEFAREGGTASVLRIQVKTMAHWRAEFPPFLAQCGPDPMALRGIGNEAEGCAGTQDGKPYYQIFSRVRERSILVRVTAADPKAGTLLREQARKVGEAVAGFIF